MECNSLEEVRAQINRIDDELVKLIAERGKYVALAATFKKSEEGVRAPDRVKAVIERVRIVADEYGADADIVEALYREMISRFTDMELKEYHK